ncbi:hemagglutinin repeat-containing protein, partial [Photorhabdus cinerea]|nr:filamentous hemagglutinin [Photorhabdus cinerea]
RQMWMVVAEIANTGPGRTGRRTRRPSLPSCRCQLTALRFSLLLALGGVSLTAQANIVADGQAPGHQPPTIIHSANGTPQVNIQTPSAAGVSHNTYRQFDVDKHGVILNNSAKATETQLGGMVAGNPWLAKGEAKIILNEVNSRDPSHLNGWIEVAGRKAEVVIANPFGITCNGCGFINAHRTTLTTGEARMEQGHLKGFDVSQGEVRIDGQGMDSRQQNYTDIIARSVALNAKLHAQDLKVTTGRNIVDAAHQTITKKSATQEAQDENPPLFALDTAALGGMYAHKILLVGTEAGVGVRNAGDIGVPAGEVRLTAEGRIENRGTISSRDALQLTSTAGIDNQGKLLSQSTVTLQSGEQLNNSGRVEARGNITARAGTIQSGNGSVWAAGLDDNGNTTRPGSLTLTALHVQAKGKNLATDTLAIHSQQIDLSGSQTAASQIQLNAGQSGISTAHAIVNANRLTAKTPGQFNNDGGQLVAREIRLTTPDLSNQQGKINQTGSGELALNTRTLNNREGMVFNQGKLTLTTDRLDNHQGTIASQGEDLHLTAHQADNTQGTVQLAGNGKLSLNTQRWLGDKGQLLTNGALTIQAGELQLNHADTQARQITVNADTLSHQRGVMQQSGADTLSLTVNTLNNQAGTIAGNGHLNVEATTVDNRQGHIVAAQQGDLRLKVKDALDNQSGRLAAGNALRLRAAQLNNGQGSIVATGNSTTLTVGKAIQNAHGHIEAKTRLTTTSQTLDNTQGVLLAQHINSQTTGHPFTNTEGQVIAGDTLTLHSGALTNTAGLLQSGGDMTVDTHGHWLANAATTDQKGGQLLSGGHLTLRTGDINNTGGIIAADGKTTLTSTALNNIQGQIAGNGGLAIHSRQLTNHNGTLQSADALTLETDGQLLDNRQGRILSEGTTTVTSGPLDNTAGWLQAGRDMTVDTRGHWLANAVTTDQKGGQLLSGGHLTLRTGDINNTGGMIAADGKTVLTSTALTNTQGQIAGNGGLAIHSQQLINREGTLQSADALTLETDGQLLDNRQGRILSEGATTVTSGQLDNTAGLLQAGREMAIDTHGHWLTNTRNADQKAGQLLSGGQLTLRTGDIDNTGGRVAGNGGLAIHSQQLTNHEGTLQSADALTLETDGQLLDNRQGRILSEGTTTVSSGPLDNRQGHLQGGQLVIHTGQAGADNREGKLLSAGRFALTTQRLDNRHGQVQAVGDTTLNVQEKTDNTGGLLRGGSQLILNTTQLINRETTHTDNGVEAQNLTINAQQADNTGGALRAAHHLQANISQTVNNTQGLISAGKQLTVKSEAQQPHLVIHNRQGTLIAGEQVNIQADALSGDGQLLSQGDMAVTLTGDFHHTGHTAANGKLTLKTTGNILNDHSLNAGQALHLDAQNLTNSASGEISAKHTQVNVHNTLTNTGLIDGDLTHLTANTLNNTGTGRIYGDQLALQTGTLNNTVQDGKAAVIAARDRLDIGTTTLNNQHHAQIYSVGDMHIGGQLDNNLTATGQARKLNNHAATMEAGRNLKIQADQIDNTNAGLVTQVVETEKSPHHDAVLRGQTARYDWSQVDTSRHNKYGVHDAIMPDGSRSDNFDEYQYTRTVRETQVKQSDPGNILAGGNLTLNSEKVTNHDSQIVAGGALGGEIGELHNIATQGERITTDTGSQTRWYAKKEKRNKLGLGGTKTSQGKDTTGYKQGPVTETIDLNTLSWQDHTRPQGTDITMTDRQTGQVQQAPTAVKPVAGINTPPLVLPPGQPVVLPPDQPVVLPPGQPFELTLPPETVKGHPVDPVIRVITPDIRLPDNSLYTVQPGSDSHYLVETDPKFTQYKQWLGSDYMQQQLTHDPALVHKRLGDGFYEQRLVREQITRLTGQRYLSGYNNDETQFKALMDAGVAFGREQQLTPGVALSPAQMARLTSDIIWLTNQTVTLPDGTTQVVTVPQVYARVRQGDLSGDGALLAGNTVALNSQGDITNSGTVSGRDVTQLTASNLTNHGFIRGGKVDLTARQDITNRGGQIQGDDRVTLKGRDITSASTVRGDEANRWLDRPAGIYVQNDKGTLSLNAINNVQLTASEVKNAGKDGHTGITAGHDLTLETLNTQHTESGDWGGGNTRHLTQQTDIGSQITGAGDVTLQAGHDLKAAAAQVNAGQQLTAQAGNNLTLTTGTASSDLVEHSKQTSQGWLAKSSVETHDEVHDRQALSTTFSGDKVNLQAGNDLHIRGSNVAGTQDVSLNAGHQLTVTTAAEAHDETHQRQEKKSGLMGTGGIGFTVGKASQKTTTDRDSQLNKGSTVGSSQGRVTLNAGDPLNIHGSDVIAGKDLTLTGQSVNITSAENHHTVLTKTEQKQSGLTVALSGTAGGAINSAVQTAHAAQQTEDPRLKALQNTQAALSGVQATQAARLAEAQGSQDPGNNTLAGVSLSYGRQSARSEQQHRQTTQQGSHLTAGDNLTMTATGNGKSDRNGDIRVQGSQLQAGKDLQLHAHRDIQLSSSQNTEQTTGKNSHHGSSLGVGVTAGPGGTGFTASANVSQGNGRESGNSVSHNTTTLQAGQTVELNSGRDTTLQGAQVSGEQITADVKRHLTFNSEQDRQRYDSQQHNASAGVSATVGPQPDGTVSLNARRSKLHSNYDSVQEQTGLFAGKGGYQVHVGDHTQLDGAVIASTADKAKNTLNTGTLGFKDIQNKADLSVEQQSAGVSVGKPAAGQVLNNLTVNALTGSNKRGHDRSTTHAAVSDGTLIIRDKAHQTQDTTPLSRDTDNAANVLSPIFDKEKEQQRLKQAQRIGELSAQMAEIAGTEGKIIATKAAKAKLDHISEQDQTAAREKLIKGGNKHPSPAAINQQVYDTAYTQALNDSGFGTGGTYQKALQAATAAIQGLAGNNLGQALAGGASPYLAGVIKELTTDPQTHQVDIATNTLAHAILGAVAAEVSGNNALSGAAGAASGELAAQVLIKQFYGDGAKVSELSEEQKQTISTLSTLAAGLAGGIAGDSTASALTGAQ